MYGGEQGLGEIYWVVVKTFATGLHLPSLCHLIAVSPEAGYSFMPLFPHLQRTQVQFLGGEDPQEKEIVTHSSILAWEISWTEEPGGLQSMGSQKSQIQLSK